ncbi:killer cell lectin-like receptor subfamily B member 1 [Mytilus californianus]|uniref:killer cell lectin-like receptor subfamily B member 1 n=1 Tax=Mytilus californianus TaxID=6549 RepID=UPI0022451224|nr:killer cell lectin-like receptor subfamily B member 1 [Mytilus californianus]
MLLIRMILFIFPITTLDFSQDWSFFQQLPDSIVWKTSSITELLYTQTSLNLAKCALLCKVNLYCKAFYFYQEACFGLSSITADSSTNAFVRVYVKQPVEECHGDGFVYYNGLCLMISTIQLTWYDAKDYCEKRHGYLLVLDSEKKHDDMVYFYDLHYPDANDQFFVGATDEENEGVWKWIITNSSSYFRFTGNQPNNKDQQFPDNQANCAALSTSRLIDEYCLQLKKFICEM